MLRPVLTSRLRGLALTLAMLSCWPCAWGQQAAANKDQTLPAGTVLAINLVSAEEVRPTTGVLVSADGLVAVPLAFAQEGAELVVLDGGGNVLRHGRRATVLHRIAASGLAILQVEGLRGTPLELAETPGVDGEQLRFGAFPPAEQMAAGVGPMWLGVTLVANPEAGIYGLEGEQPIPNVSGPLFNRCRHWVGYSLATGEPALKSEFGPIVLFSPELRRALRSVGVPVQTGFCPPAPVAEPAAAAASPPVQAADIPLAGEAEEPPPAADSDASGSPAEDPIDEQPAQDTAINPGESPAPAPTPAPDANDPHRPIATGWWLLALAALATAAWWWVRRRTKAADASRSEAAAASQPRHAAEPGAELFETVPDDRLLPPGCTGWWQLSGQSRGGHPLRLHLPFGAGHSRALVVCREDGVRLHPGGTDDAVPDVNVMGGTSPAERPVPALSLEPGVAGLVIGALHSNLHCQLAGVICLPGEKMYANPDDVIMVDGHCFSVRIMETAPK